MQRWSLLMLIVCLCVAGAARGQGVFAQERLVQHFDFDEREFNFEDLPRDWYVIGREALTSDAHFHRLPLHQALTNRQGYPYYNPVRFDKKHHASGAESLHMGLDGGSAGAFLEVGAVPAVPGADYQVTARVLTEKLEGARARMTAYFVDAKGRRIEPSVSQSDKINTHGQWQQLSLHLLGDFRGAAFIGIELELVQPQPDPDSPLGEHQIVFEQVHGGAWFDDVMIWQLPGVEVRTASKVNILRGPKRPELTATIRDQTGKAVNVELKLYDVDMQHVATQTHTIRSGEPQDWSWTPNLPRYGWYLYDLKLFEAASSDQFDTSAPIARRIGSLLYLADDKPLHPTDAGRFTLMAEELPDNQLPFIADLVKTTGLGGVTLSVWDERTTRLNLEKKQAVLDRVIEPIITTGGEVAFSLSPLPAEISQALDIDRTSVLSMFAKPDPIWEQMLAAVLLRHGQRVHRWQIGTVDMPDAFFAERVGEVIATARGDFENLAPRPEVLVPWRLNHSRRDNLHAASQVVIDVPAGVAPQRMADHLAEWSQQGSPAFSLHLREPPADELIHTRRVRDLALRMIHGWQAGAAGLSVSKPWTESDQRRLMLLPDPVFGAFVGVSHRLAGRRVVEQLSLGEGLRCLILHGPAGGALALWNESAEDGQATLDMYLGPNPQVVDIWGNRAPVPSSDGRHQLNLTRTPQFVEGIDPQLALFRAAFQLDDPFIVSLQQPHRRTVTIANPWNRTISGTMHITSPQDWRIQPRRSFFSIAAGQSTEIPLTMLFPVSEVAGHKRLTARFEFVAEQQYDVLVAAPMEVGLREVDFDGSVALEPNPAGGFDVLVTELITNRGDDLLSMYAFANLPGRPRAERVISGLRPGQSIVRRFRFEQAADDASQVRVRVGVRQASGPAVLNQVLTIDPAR